MSGCCCSEGKSDEVLRENKNKVFGRLRVAEGGRSCVPLISAESGVCCTFQDVHTLFVRWIRVGVVWRREHAAVDVADPCATVVLVGALAAMFDRRILQQKGRE